MMRSVPTRIVPVMARGRWYWRRVPAWLPPSPSVGRVRRRHGKRDRWRHDCGRRCLVLAMSHGCAVRQMGRLLGAITGTGRWSGASGGGCQNIRDSSAGGRDGEILTMTWQRIDQVTPTRKAIRQKRLDLDGGVRCAPKACNVSPSNSIPKDRWAGGRTPTTWFNRVRQAS